MSAERMKEIEARWAVFVVTPACVLRADAWDEGTHEREQNAPGAKAIRVARCESAIGKIEGDVRWLVERVKALEERVAEAIADEKRDSARNEALEAAATRFAWLGARLPACNVSTWVDIFGHSNGSLDEAIDNARLWETR